MKVAVLALLIIAMVPGAIGNAQAPVKTVLTIPELVKQKAASVVNVSTFDASGRPDKQGSGFVVDSSGTIVTAFHMLRGAASVAVKTHDGEIYDSLEVVQYDVRRDLAIIRIQPYRPLQPIPFAEDDELTIGENAAAISNPQGLDASVSAGIVSGYRQADGFRLIQTTAPVSPGSSGGPLFNMSGNIIGMVASQIESSQGQNLNFAVPVIYIRTLLKAERKAIPLRELGKIAGNGIRTDRTGDRGLIESLPSQAIRTYEVGRNVVVSFLGCFADGSRGATVCVTEFEAPKVGRYGTQLRISRARMMQGGNTLASADVGSDLLNGLVYLDPQHIVISLTPAQQKLRLYLRFLGRHVDTIQPSMELVIGFGNGSPAVTNVGVPTLTLVDGGKDAARLVFDAPVRKP